MKEQSHKEEMSKALRGDFERLRERGVSATLAPRDERQPEHGATVTEPTVRETEPVEASTADDHEADGDLAQPDGGDPAVPDTVTENDAEPQPGWLGRLFGR